MKYLSKPTGLTYKELNSFNHAYPKRLHLYTKHKGVYYTPRTFDLIKYRIDIDNIPDFLRPKQKEAVKKLLKYRYGIMLSGVGSGKSYMMAAVSVAYSGYTLIIAPKTEIAKGLYDKFKDLGIDVEIFDSKKFNGENVKYPKVLIMVSKSVNLYWEKLHLDKIYKQVLIDEVHMEFTKNRIDFFCRYEYDYIYGFTGTPELNNFPSDALFKIFNNVYVNSGIRPKEPDVYYYRYSGVYKAADEWNEIKNNIVWNKERLAKFLQIVYEVMSSGKRNMGIIFVDNVAIAEGLAEGLRHIGVYAQAYTGKISLKKRGEILKNVEKHKGVIVATYQTVGIGFDYPPLDTAFYFMFVKFKAQVKQAVGRILRGAESPEYYDFQDYNLKKQYTERMKAYKEMWKNCEIKKYKFKISCNSMLDLYNKECSKFIEGAEKVLEFKPKRYEEDLLQSI